MSAPMSLLAAEPAPHGYLILSGYLNTKTQAVTLPIAFLQAQPNDAVVDSGSCVAELTDAAATVLSSAHFTPGLTLLMQEPLVQTTGDAPAASSPPPAADLKEFSVSVPWQQAADRLQIRCAGETVYTLTRGANPPAVRIQGLASGRPTLRGTVTLAWRATAGSAPILGSQVQFSRDQGRHWSPLTPFSAEAKPLNTLRLDTTLLPSGHGLWLRVLVSDGLNTVYATRSVTITNPLKVASTTPMADAVQVSPFTPIEVQFVSPLAPAALQTSPLTLLDSRQMPLTGTLSYISDTQILRFQPSFPLQDGQRYRVHLATSLKDTTGNVLAGPVEWSFTISP